MKGKIAVLVGLALAVVLGIGVIMNISYGNKEIDNRNLITAQVEAIEANYDKMWKVLSQMAGVSEQYKDSFKDIYVGLMEGRYSKDSGTMMKWIKEDNPTFDSGIYKQLMTAIEANRTDFEMEQKKLISYSKQHKDLLHKFPGSFFLSDIEDIVITIISSSRSKAVMSSGIDDDVNLFK